MLQACCRLHGSCVTFMLRYETPSTMKTGGASSPAL
jgi:hypothetical protein